MYIPRAIESSWLEASDQFPVLLLTGPRQSGKTTLLRHLCGPDRVYVTLDDPSLRLLARDDPALFLQRYPSPVLVDEVQYAPGLLSYVKMLVDRDHRPGAFWLTGSQRFHLMHGVSETLAGRVAVVQLLGFSAREATQRPSDLPPFLPDPTLLRLRAASPLDGGSGALFERIWRGSLPQIARGAVRDWDLFWSSYVQTYVQRDVRDLAQVGSQETFFTFVRATAARTGALLNHQDLARDVGVSPNTCRSWLSILEAGGLVFLLRPWSSNVTGRLVRTPKLYFLDTGLCAWLAGWRPPAALEGGAMAGAFLETWVVGEILRSWWHQLRTPALYFYRDRDGREIDLVFEQDGRLWPVEIKASATPRADWTRFFRALDRFPQGRAHGAVVCLHPSDLPLDDRVTAFPAGWL
jgi:uncharacterized protein